MSLKSDEEFFPDDDPKDDDFSISSSSIKKAKSAKADSIKHQKKQRGFGTEARRVNARLNGFDSENSHAWQVLKEQFSSGITHSELKSIANIICLKTELKLDRDAVRDNRVLIKWFEENWLVIEPILSKLRIHDNQGEIISSTREKEIENFS